MSRCQEDSLMVRIIAEIRQKDWLQLGVARGGLEPPPTAPKAAVLPLDDRAMDDLPDTFQPHKSPE